MEIPDLKVLIPLIRKMVPMSIAEDIVGVQPMQEASNSLFKMVRVLFHADCYGSIAHHFIGGYMWFGIVDGEYDWIPIEGPFSHIKYDWDDAAQKKRRETRDQKQSQLELEGEE